MQQHDFTLKQLAKLDRTARIGKDYQATNPDGSRKYLTKQLAADYGVSASTVLRAAQSWGVAQSHAVANSAITHLKRPTRRRRAAGSC